MKVAAFVLFFSVQTSHAALPYSPFTVAELATVKAYLFKNITSTSNPFIKYDENRQIFSSPGAVLASPSNRGNRFSQDYQFHWTRDAAITMHYLVSSYSSASNAERRALRDYFMNYINFERMVQKQVSNPGEQTLGQPKFNIDTTVWEGPWGRPQNDGAALRAYTLIGMATIFLNVKDEKWVRENILPLIITDLNYVVSEWQNPSFDVWEEVNDPDHFFNKMVQRKSLIAGAALLLSFNDREKANQYAKTANDITASLSGHWNESKGYLTETIKQQENKGGGLDSSIMLGVLYGNLQLPNDAYALSTDQVMSSVYHLRETFANLYTINREHPDNAPLIGRYVSDVYDGDQFKNGNPWILTTNVLAQYYYDLAYLYRAQGVINVTKLNLPFFKQINPHLVEKERVVTAAQHRVLFNAIIFALIGEGDKVLQTVKQYAACYPDKTCLHYAEQIDRDLGTQTSAKDLTWSYASLLMAMQSRSKVA
jgi:glucoamylase